MFARILTVSNLVRVAMWRNVPSDTICVPIEVFDNEQLTVVTRRKFILDASVLFEGSTDGKAYFPIKDTTGVPILTNRMAVHHVMERSKYVRPSVIGSCEAADIDIHLIMQSAAAEK